MTIGAPLFERGPPLSEIQNSSIFSLDDVSDEEMNSLIDGTITDFDEGDLVTGTVVKIERDEVLLDIGFKSEGVIPVRELSIRKDANPADIVAMGETIEALVLQKEDKDGRLILSKKQSSGSVGIRSPTAYSPTSIFCFSSVSSCKYRSPLVYESSTRSLRCVITISESSVGTPQPRLALPGIKLLIGREDGVGVRYGMVTAFIITDTKFFSVIYQRMTAALNLRIKSWDCRNE